MKRKVLGAVEALQNGVEQVIIADGRVVQPLRPAMHQTDLICLAKAIASGVPMGATLLGPRVGELPRRVHGSTFGGNALACAAALATIRILESEDLPCRATQRGAHLMEGLRAVESPLVREVHGMGLMIGVHLKARAGSYLATLVTPVDELWTLAFSAGSMVMRFLPPLVIDEEDVDRVVACVEAVLAEGE
jgi:acetylornithine/LysW-gamma-L-lysine aminotransferase